jgi:rare lipoprotein A
MKRFLFLFLAGSVFLITTVCARPARQETTPILQVVTGQTPSVTVPARSWYRETGIASWYGKEFDGRTAADGSVFDMNGISAAHRTLPLGTAIRVTNLDNSTSITTTVTDRGPLYRDRILELSYGAARALGFVTEGIAPVLIETDGPVPEGGTWTVLAASFAEKENAKVLKYRLSQRYEFISIVPYENNIGKFYYVRVGNYSSEEKAERIAAKLTLEGLEPVVFRWDGDTEIRRP